MSQTVWPLNENGEIVFTAGTGSSNVTGYLNQDVLPSAEGGGIPVVLKGFGEEFTPEQFGAIGDGNPHPLSERYASLADAQSVYPFTTSLSQEIDWAAFQAAINAANNAVIKCRSPNYRVSTLNVNGKTLTFDLGESTITAVSVVQAIFLSTNSVCVFNGGKIDGANQAKRGADFRSGGELHLIGTKLENFTASDMFCAAVYGNGISGPYVMGCRISNVSATGNGTIGDELGAARGVYAISCTNPTVDHSTILGVTGEEGDSVQFAIGCIRPVATNNYIKGFSRRGIKDQSGGSLIDGNYVDDGDLTVEKSNAAPAIDQIVGGKSNITNNTVIATGCLRGIQAVTSENYVCGNKITIGNSNTGENGFTGPQQGIVSTGDKCMVIDNVINGGFDGWVVSGNYSKADGNISIDCRVEAGQLGPVTGSQIGLSGNGNVAIGLTDGNMPFRAYTIRNIVGGAFTNVTGNIPFTNNVVRMSGTVQGVVVGPFAASQKQAAVNPLLTGNVNNHTIATKSSFDPPSIAAGTAVTTTVSVTGAALGDIVSVSYSGNLSGIVLTGWVSATGVVSVSFFNPTGAAVDLANGTLSILVRGA